MNNEVTILRIVFRRWAKWIQQDLETEIATENVGQRNREQRLASSGSSSLAFAGYCKQLLWLASVKLCKWSHERTFLPNMQAGFCILNYSNVFHMVFPTDYSQRVEWTKALEGIRCNFWNLVVAQVSRTYRTKSTFINIQKPCHFSFL